MFNFKKCTQIETALNICTTESEPVCVHFSKVNKLPYNTYMNFSKLFVSHCGAKDLVMFLNFMKFFLKIFFYFCGKIFQLLKVCLKQHWHGPFSSKLFGTVADPCSWWWSQMSRQFDYLVHVLVSSGFDLNVTTQCSLRGFQIKYFELKLLLKNRLY